MKNGRVTGRMVINGSGATGLAADLAVACREWPVRETGRALLSRVSVAELIQRTVTVLARVKDSNARECRVTESPLVLSLLH
jgi:hypothetical protein